MKFLCFLILINCTFQLNQILEDRTKEFQKFYKTALFSKVKHNRDYSIDNLHKIHTPPSRMLNEYDLNQLKSEIDFNIAKEGWESTIDQQSLLISKIEIDKKQAPTYFFRAKIETSSIQGTSEKRSFIVFSNRPQAPEKHFKMFENHHAFFRRAISLDNSPRSKTLQTQFIKDSIDKFKIIVNSFLSPVNVKQLYEFVKKIIGEIGDANIVLRDKFDLNHSISFDLFKKDTNELMYQVILYQIGKGIFKYFGIEFTVRHNTHLITVPRMDIESGKEDIARIIKLPEPKPEGKPLPIEDLVEKIKKLAKEACESDPPKIESKSSPKGSLLLHLEHDSLNKPTNSKEICPFINSDFVITQYFYGYMQYFHLMYESKYLQQESLLFSTKDKIDSDLKNTFDVLKKSMSYVHKEQTESISEIPLELAQIKAAFEETFKETNPTEDLNENANKQGVNELATWTFEQSKIIVKVALIGSDFRIEMKKIDEKNASIYGEIFVPKINGYNQKGAIIYHIEDFLRKVNSGSTD